MGRGLLLWGGGSTASARARAEGGARVVAWPGCDTSALMAAGVAFARVDEVLPPDALEATAAARVRWARVWPRLPLSEGRSFRELVAWRGESLLWAVEGFLRDATAGPSCAATVELCLRLFAAVAPEELDVQGLSAADAALVARAATVAGVLFHGDPGRPRPLPVSPRVRRVGWRLRLSGGSPPRPAAGAGRALVLVSEPDPAAARLSALLDALRREAGLEPALVALGDLPRFETRRVRRAIAEARRALRALHTSLRTTPALAATYVHRGVSFADLAAADLEVLLGAQLPAMVGFVESALELVESARPSALVLDVADPDERRALGTVARVAGLPWLAVAARETVLREPPERADAGPQPAATVDPGEPEHASAIARLLQAMRGSVGAP